MGALSTDKIRNLVLLGQDGSGKTSLAEAMLYMTKRTNRMGTTSDGKSNLDFDSEEIKRKFTISTSIAPITFGDYKFNLLDTSGFSDFMGDTVAAMFAAELGLFVVDAVAGPQVATKKLWRKADETNMARAIFINHVDREHTDFDIVMDALTKAFGKRLGAVTIPMGVAENFKGVVDIVRMKARVWKDGKEIITDIPAEYADAAESARETLCELIAEADDELLMKYFEGEPFEQDEIETLLKLAISQDIFVPVFVGSTLVMQGVYGLMEDIAAYFPAPTEHAPIASNDGDIEIDPAGEPAGYVFKTLSDPFVGRLSYIKVLSGKLEPNIELSNGRTGKKERLGHLYVMMGKENTDVKEAVAGDIIVVPKLSEATTGDTLSAGGHLVVEGPKLPEPLYPVAIEAANKKDEDKLGDFLAKAVETDPTLVMYRDEETHQTIVKGLGETQIDVVLSRIKDRNGIAVNQLPIRVPYRESIRRTAQAQGRHKKQTGGSGQFGDCWLRVEPNPGMGYEFLDEVVGGRIPRNFIPAVDKGVRETMADGILAGYPMVDIKCAVYDGSYHPVDSNEMAFKTAARLGLKNACAKADMYLLEPMANITVTVDEEYAGSIMSDMPTKRGRIEGMSTNEFGESVIKARVPYAEVVQYGKQLRSLTRGSGEYTIEVEGYEEVPRDQAAKIIAEYEASKNEK
ncbi:MAG: elongation factor G [Coriobacteriales bacterium]|nr:elongation factor G [Coriobacteriales bacterium]